jgi:hypothetical protein
MKSFATLLFLAAFTAVAHSSPDVATNNVQPAAQITQSPTNSMTNSPIELSERLREECIRGRRSICGKVLRVFPEGIVVESGYTNLLREPLNKSWLIPGSVTATLATNLVESTEPNAICVGTVFVSDLPRGGKPKQYDYVVLTAYPAGQHTYTSVGAIHKTVRHFSANLEQAIRLDFQAATNALTPH